MRVSVSSGGVEANGDSSSPSLDGDTSHAPHCVAFVSTATNLASGTPTAAPGTSTCATCARRAPGSGDAGQRRRRPGGGRRLRVRGLRRGRHRLPARPPGRPHLHGRLGRPAGPADRRQGRGVRARRPGLVPRLPEGLQPRPPEARAARGAARERGRARPGQRQQPAPVRERQRRLRRLRVDGHQPLHRRLPRHLE